MPRLNTTIDYASFQQRFIPQPETLEGPHEWSEQLPCRESPELFYEPDYRESEISHAVRERSARNVCLSCEARQKCLLYAISTEEPFGIWGGMNTRERNAYVKESLKSSK